MKTLTKIYESIVSEDTVTDDVSKIRFYEDFLTQDFDPDKPNYDPQRNEIMDILFLTHSKLHTIKNTSTESKVLNKIFKKIENKSVCNVPLYRGLYSEDIGLFKIGELYKFDRYQSFSESLYIAKLFAHRTKSNLVIKLNPPIKNGFPLYKMAIDYFINLKKENIDAFDSSDGEFAIDGYNKESEWIFNIGTCIKILNIYKLDEYTIIEAEMVK